MMKKKWLAFLLSVCLLVATLPFTAMAAASDFEVEDGVLLKYNGNAASVTVPAGVFYIGDGAFEGNTSLKSVTLPDGVYYIGNKAFYSCKI